MTYALFSKRTDATKFWGQRCSRIGGSLCRIRCSRPCFGQRLAGSSFFLQGLDEGHECVNEGLVARAGAAKTGHAV